MTQVTLDTSKGQLVALVFGQDAVAASQTDVQLPVGAGEASQAVDGYIAPFPGQIVAVTWATDTAVTAGLLTVGATLGGTEDVDTTIQVAGGTGGRQAIRRGLATFAAGDRIGAEITSDAEFLPITADLSVVVYVLYHLEGI